jgi:hypothetical protein
MKGKVNYLYLSILKLKSMLKELFKRLLLEMNYVSNVDEVIYDEGIMCISGLIEWDEINRCFEDVDVSVIENEVKDFIRCEIYSDEDVLKLI